MTTLIGVLSLLSALAATSYALSCTQCTSESSSCTGDRVTCPSGHLCGLAYSETFVDGKPHARLIRSCSPPSKCSIKGSITIEEGKTRTVTSCCDKDDCDPDIPTLPTIISYPNGLVCPTCSSLDSTWCETSDTLQCTGNENMCLLLTMHVTGPASSGSSVMRGCATKSICEIGSQSESNGVTSAEQKFSCTSDGTSVHKVVLTPAIACLLLLKLFF